MIYKARQVLESVPELVECCGRATDNDALLHTGCMLTELLRAEHVDKRHSEHGCRGGRDPVLPCPGCQESRAQTSQIDRVTPDT